MLLFLKGFLNSYADSVEWLSKFTGLKKDPVEKILISIGILLALWLISKLVSFLVLNAQKDPIKRFRFRKTINYSTYIVGAVAFGQVWVNNFESVFTFFGIVSAGLAIALRDPLTNLAGWVYIIWRKPFDVGDRVQSGKNSGDVIDIKIFSFNIMEIGEWVDAEQSTGRILSVPNANIFRFPLANYTKSFDYIWHEIPVLITFESNWKKAKAILFSIINAHADSYSQGAEQRLRQANQDNILILYSRITPTVYTTVKESGVMLTLRYLCNPKKRRNSEEEMWEEILDTFQKEDDIQFAYPTQRFFTHNPPGFPVRNENSEMGSE